MTNQTFAHYVNNKTLVITLDCAGQQRIAIHKVEGKRQARKLAATLNSTPWNF